MHYEAMHCRQAFACKRRKGGAEPLQQGDGRSPAQKKRLLRQQHLVDHMDHAVGCHDVCGCYA